MAGRQSTLSIDLGGEQILLRKIEAIEGLSRPFQINVDIFSSLSEIDLLPHLGKPAAVTILEDDEHQRHFHGIITEGEHVSESRSGFQYTLVLRPWTHILSFNRDFAIYQEQSVVDIIKKVLKHSPMAKIDYGGITGTLTKRPYTVQYGESDFQFISRLLEEEGIYYYFKHEKNQHVLMLVDSPRVHESGQHPDLIYNPEVATIGNVNSQVRGEKVGRFIHRWHERVVTGAESRAAMRDWDFEKPQQPVEGKWQAKSAHPLDGNEVYQWPGRYLTNAEGDRLSEVLLTARRADRRTYSGESQLSSITPGYKIKLKDHPNSRFNIEYLVTHSHHIISSETYASGESGGEHNIAFEAVPADTQWRAPLTTPRPVVRGPQTAIVSGPSGEEIYTDKFGRIKVRFHWDRADTSGEKSTCWIRVGQTGGLGNIIIPRVGHEVLVHFEHGDPDRPLVVGTMFNKEQMPIYELPDHKTKALWRTKTYGSQSSYGAAKKLDTGEPKANELRFEDKGGKEEVFLHAERDMNLRVRHKESHHIGLDQEIQIGGSRKTKIDKTDKLDVGQSITIDAGTTIAIQAPASITLTCGESEIKLEPMKITIKTVMLETQAKMSHKSQALMTEIKGDAMLTLKGGITMINC